MLHSSKHSLPALALLLLAACRSVPVPEPVAAPEPEPVVEAVAVQPEAIDFNQQFYEDAIAALKSGKTGPAIALLERVSRDAPGKPFVFTNLGLAYFKLEKYERADNAFQQAILQDKRDAVAHNHLGILKRRKGEFAAARNHYQRAIQINRKYAHAHLNLGILFDIYLQDLEKALQQYERYQALTSAEDSQVAAWIVDLQRRLKSTSKSRG